MSRFHPLEIIEELLKKGAKVNMVDKHGHTALHLACIIGSKEIIEILLKHHAMPHIRDKKGKMAIDYTKSVSSLFFIPFFQVQWIYEYSQVQ